MYCKSSQKSMSLLKYIAFTVVMVAFDNKVLLEKSHEGEQDCESQQRKFYEN